ncbi:hypothetical protein SAMN05421820_113179 [Pedobacter steynii]|uniref:Uncharacterized protein n=1 Tax=Pedobacter steynii TaxID=430522 RepID=A0A1H0IJL4_9SPHI|nr:hypothetical protein SAMN05421820_113179 [Pedobacter steynii]
MLAGRFWLWPKAALFYSGAKLNKLVKNIAKTI